MTAVRLNRKLRALGRRRVASWTLIAAKIDAVRADIDAAAPGERERVARSMRLADLLDPLMLAYAEQMQPWSLPT